MVNEFWWRCVFFKSCACLPGGMGIHYQIIFVKTIEYGYICIYIYKEAHIMMLRKRSKICKEKKDREREREKNLTRSWSIFSQQTEDLNHVQNVMQFTNAKI